MYKPPFEDLDKSKEELLKLINGTKNRMGRLRNVMEHPDYKYRAKKSPSDLVVYKCDRDFLNMAIIKYISKGGEYKYSKAELKDTNFNDNLENIKKIIFYNGTCFSIPKRTIIDLSSNELKISSGDYSEMFNVDTGYDKENFLYELGELHLGEWRPFYNTKKLGVAVLDGVQWFLEIQYKNGRKKKFSGSNAFPYNYDDLLSLLCSCGVEIQP